MIRTATVSPSARPSPSIEAAIVPLRPNGSTVIRTTSHLVAPSACAASMWVRGVCRNTSRVTAVMIGRIITASTTPGGEDRAATASRRCPWRTAGTSPGVVQQLRDRLIAGARTNDAPQPEDDRRDRGEQVDHAPKGRASRARRVLGQEDRDADRDRHREHQRERRSSAR